MASTGKKIRLTDANCIPHSRVWVAEYDFGSMDDWEEHPLNPPRRRGYAVFSDEIPSGRCRVGMIWDDFWVPVADYHVSRAFGVQTTMGRFASLEMSNYGRLRNWKTGKLYEPWLYRKDGKYYYMIERAHAGPIPVEEYKLQKEVLQPFAKLIERVAHSEQHR